MAQITRDIIGGDVSFRADATIIRRVFALDDVTGGSSDRRLWNAARASGVPRVGAQHPSIKTAFCTSVRASPEAGSPTQFRVEVEYSTAPPPEQISETEIEVEWALDFVEESVFRDRNGDKIQSRYFSTGRGSGSISTSVQIRTHTVTIEKAMYSCRLTRTMNRSARSLNLEFANTVNGRPWSGFDTGSVRCRGFQSSQTAPKEHRVTGLFAFSPTASGLWRAEVTASVDGSIPDDVRDGNGLDEWDVYPFADFNRTGFVVPSE